MKPRSRFLNLLEVAKATMQNLGSTCIGLFVTVILPMTRRIVGLIDKTDRTIKNRPSSLDMLILQDLKKILESFPSMACPAPTPPISDPYRMDRSHSFPRWILRSLYKIDVEFNGRAPIHLKILHHALGSLQRIYHASQNATKKYSCKD